MVHSVRRVRSLDFAAAVDFVSSVDSTRTGSGTAADAAFAALARSYPTADWPAWGVLGARVVVRAAPLSIDRSRLHARLVVTTDGARRRPWGRSLTLTPRGHGAPLSLEVHYVPGTPVSPQAARRVTSATAEVPRAGALIEAIADGRRAVGTLGWIFVGRDDRRYLMSNWHVLCAASPEVRRGGRVHLAGSGRAFATLHAYARIAPDALNTWDLAIARFDDDADAHGGFAVLDAEVPREAPSALAAPVDGDVYFKVGASTGYREARFAGVGAHQVAFGRGWRFQRLVFFERPGRSRFSHDGDSGSVVVHARSGAACALLLGGFATTTGSVGVGCPIHAAFRVIGRVRTRMGEVLPRLDYPAYGARDPEWVGV